MSGTEKVFSRKGRVGIAAFGVYMVGLGGYLVAHGVSDLGWSGLLAALFALVGLLALPFGALLLWCAHQAPALEAAERKEAHDQH